MRKQTEQTSQSMSEPMSEQFIISISDIIFIFSTNQMIFTSLYIGFYLPRIPSGWASSFLFFLNICDQYLFTPPPLSSILSPSRIWQKHWDWETTLKYDTAEALIFSSIVAFQLTHRAMKGHDCMKYTNVMLGSKWESAIQCASKARNAISAKQEGNDQAIKEMVQYDPAFVA